MDSTISDHNTAATDNIQELPQGSVDLDEGNRRSSQTFFAPTIHTVACPVL